jgi:DNA mismatch repair protein MutL
MGRIRILSDNVANKIAAGEVVERPASVVKELLENSLDAGASDFRLDIEAGGRKLIRLADDGSGMMHDDALLAFERHATSKLSDVKDLLSISTLGFRGEALPSIASVSRLLLETQSREESVGTLVEIAGGKMFRVEDLAHPGGTTITVRDLFFNVPARKKFLRSEQTEIAHIASLITHYSLAHPSKRCGNASFKSSARRYWTTCSTSATTRATSRSPWVTMTSRSPAASACEASSAHLPSKR